jgi:hypothetical protein
MDRGSEQDRFEKAVAAEVERFPQSRLISRLETSRLELAHYHHLLITLFHQTRRGPYTFARAAVNCHWRHQKAKEYLLRHADEEKTHWRWLLEDLDGTAYRGPDPSQQTPGVACEAYLGLNYHIAEEAPFARLAIAAVLEGIAAAHGGHYGRCLMRALGLRPEQASFILNHAETDRGHSQELMGVIAGMPLSAEEWMWMRHAAESAGALYRGMYDQDVFA